MANFRLEFTEKSDVSFVFRLYLTKCLQSFLEEKFKDAHFKRVGFSPIVLLGLPSNLYDSVVSPVIDEFNRLYVPFNFDLVIDLFNTGCILFQIIPSEDE